jgi:thiamine pyrophosphate-dependent acetolactate synthase large subunit-like protein
MGNGRVADCYIQADARDAVAALVEALGTGRKRRAGLRTPAVARALRRNDHPEYVREDGAVDPRQAAAVLDDDLAPGVGLVVGNGHFTGFLMAMRRPRAPFLATLAFGCIGQGLGTATGAALAAKRPLALIEGDGSVLMHIQELDTLARYQIPLLVVVMNDQALGGEYHKLPAHERDIARMTTPDLAAVARAFGVSGHRVRRIDELRRALADFAAAPRPMVIDLRISRAVSRRHSDEASAQDIPG